MKSWKSILCQLEQGFEVYIDTPKPKREERKRILKNVIEGKYKKGDVVHGKPPPYGGSWTYDPEGNESALSDPPPRRETWEWDWE